MFKFDNDDWEIQSKNKYLILSGIWCGKGDYTFSKAIEELYSHRGKVEVVYYFVHDKYANKTNKVLSTEELERLILSKNLNKYTLIISTTPRYGYIQKKLENINFDMRKFRRISDYGIFLNKSYMYVDNPEDLCKVRNKLDNQYYSKYDIYTGFSEGSQGFLIFREPIRNIFSYGSFITCYFGEDESLYKKFISKFDGKTEYIILQTKFNEYRYDGFIEKEKLGKYKIYTKKGFISKFVIEEFTLEDSISLYYFSNEITGVIGCNSLSIALSFLKIPIIFLTIGNSRMIQGMIDFFNEYHDGEYKCLCEVYTSLIFSKEIDIEGISKKHCSFWKGYLESNNLLNNI